MKKALLLLLFFKTFTVFSQKDSTHKGTFSGSIQADFQKYVNDNSLIYNQLEKKFASNNYLTLQYQYRRFLAGVRLEGYFPPLLGYPYNLEGKGLANRFVNYQSKKISATVGSFYEQFGSGMLLRLQQQRFLGMDTSLDGFQLKANPTKNYALKLIGGKQRLGFKHADGIVVGIDNEFRLSKDSSASQWTGGLSFVNKKRTLFGYFENRQCQCLGNRRKVEFSAK